MGGDLNATKKLKAAKLCAPPPGLFTATEIHNQPPPRHTGTLLPNGTVLVAGGRIFSGTNITLASAEIFDPTANNGGGAFTPIGNMNSPRDDETATLLPNGKVLLTGGLVRVCGAFESYAVRP